VLFETHLLFAIQRHSSSKIATALRKGGAPVQNIPTGAILLLLHKAHNIAPASPTHRMTVSVLFARAYRQHIIDPLPSSSSSTPPPLLYTIHGSKTSTSEEGEERRRRQKEMLDPPLDPPDDMIIIACSPAGQWHSRRPGWSWHTSPALAWGASWRLFGRGRPTRGSFEVR